MLASRILFVSTYPELSSSAQKLSSDLSIPLVIHEGGIMADGHLYAKKMQRDFDVIISHGGTSATIAKVVDIPVVPIEITAIDFSRSLFSASQLENPIALVCHEAIELYGLDDLRKMFDIEYKVLSYSDKKGLVSQLKKAVHLNQHTLLGMGSCIQYAAMEKELDFVLVKSTDSAIAQAIIKAKNIVERNKSANFKSTYLKTVATLQNAPYIEQQKNVLQIDLQDKRLVAKNTFANLIGNCPVFENVLKKAAQFAKTGATILIEGETGTGKELFAQSIHNESPRKNGPFVAFNCAALPENLLESELFGYEDGAFTGAKRGGKSGLFELAQDGTIFLDEIGETSLGLQSRLLRVLQEKEVLRVGGNRMISVNARIITATNKNLYELVEAGKFRQDLYFRISLLNIKIPPLRERIDDLPELARHFLAKASQLYRTEITDIAPQSIKLLKNYHWPGNVRELENLIEKMVILADSPVIDAGFAAEMLSEYTRPQQNCGGITTEDAAENKILVEIGSWESMEAQIISTLYKKLGNNKMLLAKTLNLSRGTIWHKLNKINGKL